MYSVTCTVENGMFLNLKNRLFFVNLHFKCHLLYSLTMYIGNWVFCQVKEQVFVYMYIITCILKIVCFLV